MKNIYNLDDFKGKKSNLINENIESDIINESVEAIDQSYRVSFDIDVPKALIASYIKKVKESAGKDLRQKWGEERLAEKLVQWALENYMNIENLPVDIVTGTDKAPVQAQAQAQIQTELPDDVQDTQDAQAQSQVQAPAQAQTQAQSQVQAPTQNTQAQKPAVQVQSAQNAAAQVPAQEI